MLAIAAGVVLPLAAFVVFAFVCAREARREAARASGLIDLMRVSGASDSYIAGLIRSRVAGLALVCVLWGATGAMAATALISKLGAARAFGGLARDDFISPWPLLLVALWLAGVGAAWLAARGKAAP
jgi:hypothetical protein